MESAEQKGLTSEEDDSLRRLAWFAKTVGVSSWSRARIEDLRQRDRRSEVRPPREEAISDCAADILSRADLKQVAPETVLRKETPPTTEDPLDQGTPGVADLASLTVVRQKKRRHPWSLRRNARGS